MQFLRDNRNLLLIGGGLTAFVIICACLSLLVLVLMMDGNGQKQAAAQQPPTAFVIATPLVPVNTPTQQPTMTATPRPTSTAISTVISTCTVRTDWPLYIVVTGDTLGSIAQRTGSTTNALATANCLSNPNNIQAGQQLRVPVVPIPPTVPPTIVSTNPQMVLNPSFGGVNTPVTVIVSGFPVNALVEVHLAMKPNQLSSEVYASAWTNGSGAASMSFVMPEQWTLGIPIISDVYVAAVAHDSPPIRAYATFTWSMTRQLMFINPIDVTAGTAVTVALSGFPANQEVGIHLGRSERDYDAAAILSVRTDATGGASIQFNLPDHWQDNTPITINKLYLVATTLDFRYISYGDLMYTPIVQTMQ